MTVWCRLTVYGPDGEPLGRWTLLGDSAPDLEAVDRIARLHLAACSLGGTAALSDGTPALAEVFELAGLGELYGQMRRESERRERPLHGALERVEAADPPAGDLEDL